jgi:hypothetical protein
MEIVRRWRTISRGMPPPKSARTNQQERGTRCSGRVFSSLRSIISDAAATLIRGISMISSKVLSKMSRPAERRWRKARVASSEMEMR